MAEGQIDQVPQFPEPPAGSHTRLLFHLSTLPGEYTESSMAEFGLLSRSPALTPDLDVAQTYTGAAFSTLTFWYPQGHEVDRGRQDSKITPTLPVTDEMKEDMRQKLAETDLGKQSLLRSTFENAIDDARTYLPGKRLRALVRLNDDEVTHLKMQLPQRDGSIYSDIAGNILTDYPKVKDKIVERVREVLVDNKTVYLDPSLDADQLARDVVRTTFEYALLNVGRYSSSRSSVQSSIDLLSSAKYDEPVYERYRQRVLRNLQKRLSDLPQEASE